MNWNLEMGIPAVTVFLQGILSFFSPCVLPLVPLYIGYLAGGARKVEEDGTVRYGRRKVMTNTLFFVFGISFAFFALGLGFSFLGRFFSGNRDLFIRIGGILILVFGLYQLGVFGAGFLGRERRLPFKADILAMNPWIALLMGFTFSFAWTPCVGPALTSVLLMASSAEQSWKGFLLIGVYTAGFVLPFLAVGFFTGSLLNLFKKHQKLIRYTGKAAGVLMIFMGIMMLTGWMNGITGYLSRIGNIGITGEEQAGKDEAAEGGLSDDQEAAEDKPDGLGSQEAAQEEEEKVNPPAPDFTLTDQNGVEHTLSDYKGKVVFLNFWATWCGPCQREMPDIEELYQEYGENGGELVILGVANPSTKEKPFNQDVTEEEVKAFLAENEYSYPTVMDLDGSIFGQYGIRSFPTTFMIDTEGRVYGYITGILTKSKMLSIIEQTIGRLPEIPDQEENNVSD